MIHHTDMPVSADLWESIKADVATYSGIHHLEDYLEWNCGIQRLGSILPKELRGSQSPDSQQLRDCLKSFQA